MSESTSPPTRNDTWTIDTYAAHNEALRDAEAKFQDERQRFMDERDRRYSEVKNAEEKALRIKEEADKTALGLQRENQQYRDEKGNELRAQIERERVTYATRNDIVLIVDKFETQLKPLNDYVSSQQGRKEGIGTSTAMLVTVATLLIAGALLWVNSHRATQPIIVNPTVTAPTK